MRASFVPRTLMGKWSAGLIIAALLFFAVFLIEIAAGLRGGDTWNLGDLAPATPVLLAGACAISAFLTGTIGIIASKERSIAVFLATAIGLYALIFVLGEILFPH
jgi:hypothetical protein